MTGASHHEEPWPRGRSRHGGIDRLALPAGVPGGLWLAGKRYVAPDPAAALASVSADVVVCLCEAFELEGHWPGYVEWLRRAGPAAIWTPVPDLGAPSREAAADLVGRVAALLDAGDQVVVHCGAGMGRAGTVAAAVLLHYGLDLPAALGAVAAARPGAGPEVGAQAELLRALEKA